MPLPVKKYLLLPITLTALLSSPTQSTFQPEKCTTYINHFENYRCIEEEPFIQSADTATFLVSKNGIKHFLKISEKSAENLHEYQILKKVSGLRYVLNLEESEMLPNALLTIVEKYKYGHMFEAVDTREEFSDPRFVLKFFQKVVNAVQNVHNSGFVHADIKPENILVTEALDPVLIDFDNSVAINSKHAIVGSPIFLPPENQLAIQENREVLYDEKTDVFALGAILYILFVRETPISDNLNYDDFLSAQVSFPPYIPKLVVDMIQKTYCIRENRITMAELTQMVVNALKFKNLQKIGYNYLYKVDTSHALNRVYIFQRYKSYIAIGIALGVLISAGVGVWFWLRQTEDVKRKSLKGSLVKESNLEVKEKKEGELENKNEGEKNLDDDNEIDDKKDNNA